MKKWFVLIALILSGQAHSLDLSKAFINLAKKVSSSVVNISITKEEMNNMIQIFPGHFMPFKSPQFSAEGSGFIVGSEGFIVTNWHVVQNFDKIQVQFDGDSNFYTAKIIGSDRLIDIALLKADTDKQLVPFKFGDSEKLQVGEWVAAIGNPHGYGHTMTKGIISALKREIDDLNLLPLLQTDASINPGNSGGPLVNLKGEVVGVNQAIVRGATGISFAIPINNVKTALDDLKAFGFIRRGFIGVEFRTYGQTGALITKVIPRSPADKSGLKVNDQIIEFSGKRIVKPRDLPKAVQKAAIGKSVQLKVLRNGRQISVSISPKLLEKDSFYSLNEPSPEEKSKIKGQLINGGFKLAPASVENLRYFKQPSLGAKHPLVVDVKKQSPAFRGGLRAGDLIFEVNGVKIEQISQVRRSLRSGVNQLNVLRYHPRYDKYLLISVRLTL